MNTARVSLLPLLLALASPGAAQDLIGLTLNSPRIIETSHGSCSLVSNCGPIPLLPTLPPVPSYWPGGAAWDTANDGLWVTTGITLARVSPVTCTTGCVTGQCPRFPGSLTTGLDMHETTNELWGIDDAGRITSFTASSTCVTAIQNQWNTGLVAIGNLATTDITIDEARGLVFYSTSDFGVGSGTIYVALIASPGTWFQSDPVQDCNTNPSLITGLAADSSNSVLYWTNGRGTFAWNYTYSGGVVTYTQTPCCIQSAPFGEPYIDLAIRRRGPVPIGNPCANGNCVPCPMVHTLGALPLMGSVLPLVLSQAQPATLTLCAVGLGACNSAGPVIPPLCGPLMVPLPVPLILGSGIPVGGGPCSASHTEFLPLPAPQPSLVGTLLSSQFVSLCSGSGTAMSNCLTWALQ